MGELKIFRNEGIEEFFELLNSDFHHEFGSLILLDRPLGPKQAAVIQNIEGVVCFAVGFNWNNEAWPPYIHAYLDRPEDPLQMSWALEQAKRLIELKHMNQQLKIKLDLENERRQKLMQAATSVTSERDLPKLCQKILSSMRHLVDAEGASLFLIKDDGESLEFNEVQNEKLRLEAPRLSLPINEKSIAGACASRKQVINLPDVYSIPDSETFSFNPEFDRKYQYRTRSLLAIPLLKKGSELVGVVQLVNSKRREYFNEDDEDICRSLSAQIAISIETAQLYQDIENLFESFVKASVTAIEARDPTTSGHSERVAVLTVGLAEAVSASEQKAFKPHSFSESQLKEIRYASLLHDFGKIGVSEEVLVKSKKLYPHELESLLSRLKIIRLSEPKLAKELEDLERLVREANEPSILEEDVKQDLDQFLERKHQVLGDIVDFLRKEEWQKLIVRKGSLSEEERRQIESHVVHTTRFLDEIQWTKELWRVPRIAQCHHERLNGSGYPNQLQYDQIPFESQLMAVADVFDALTAMDRPYKKAVPVSRAHDILKMEADEKKLNKDIVELFLDQNLASLVFSKGLN